MPQVSLDRLSPAEFTLTVTLEPQDYRQPAEAELKRIARTTKIKGFRPGKVPTAFVKQTYGRGAIAQAIGKKVDEAINARIKEDELNVFGQLQPVQEPDLSNISPDLNETLTFVYEGGLIPEVDAVDTSSLNSVSRYSIELSDEEVSTRLANASKNFIDFAEQDSVSTEQDYATLVLSDSELDAKFYGAEGAAHSAEPTIGNDAKQEADADSATHEHADELDAEEEDKDPRQQFYLRPEDMVEDSRYKLIDRAKGTEIVLAIADLKELVRERFQKVIDGEDTKTFTIAKVEREVLPEFNHELFQKLFGEDTEVSSEEEAKVFLSERFSENSQENLDEFTLEKIIDALDESNPIPVPSKAIKSRLELVREEELEKAEKENRKAKEVENLTEADRHGLARRLKWMAFRKQLLKQYDVDILPADMDAAVEKEYNKALSGMGIDPQMFRDRFFDTFKQNLFSNQERMFELTDGILTSKIVAKLEEEGLLAARKTLSEKGFQEEVEKYNKSIDEQLQSLRSQPLA